MNHHPLAHDLAWGTWLDLANIGHRRSVSSAAGLYKVRMRGAADLVYVGQTASLTSRMQHLSVCYRDEMPYNDPHTATPCLWVLRTEQKAEFEFSTCSLAGDPAIRKAFECVEVSEHRERFGHSPFANFGRMPEGWFKSTGNTTALAERGLRHRGYRDASATRSADHPCVVDHLYSPVDPGWGGLAWSGWTALDQTPAVVGVYRVRQPEEATLAYVGQGAVRARLRSHLAKGKNVDHRQWAGFRGSAEASWFSAAGLTSQQLLEMECDLIASHVLHTGVAPAVQFLG